MRLWFTGAESAAYRKLLLANGVQTAALNLSAYFKQRQAMEMRDVYEGFDLVLYSSEGGLDQQKVQQFVDANGDRFEMIYGIKCDHEKRVTEWNGFDVNDFYRIAEPLDRIGVSETVALNEKMMRFIIPYARRNKIGLMVSSSKGDVLRYQWDEVIQSGWSAAAKHRELQVWDGEKVARYSRAARADAVQKHYRQLEALGCDPQAILDDDPEALLLAAVRSWQLYGEKDAQVVAMDPLRLLPDIASDSQDGLAIERVPPRNRERIMLPVLTPSLNPAEPGEEPVAGPPVVSTQPLRSCNGCNLSGMCPAYEADASCGFHIPVRITTKGELQNAMNSLLEMQMQRVVMARFAEDLLSQGIDPAVSSEIERFMRMVESTKKIAENTESLTIVAKSQAGVISRLFGQEAGQANLRLNAPVAPNALNEAIFDAEIVGDPDSN